MNPNGRYRRKISWIRLTLAPVLLILAGAAHAQLQPIPNLNMNLSGTLAFGYSGAYGTFLNSTHATGLSGSGTLRGFYYHPQFLSFAVQPFFNRSQSNSLSQSIFTGRGFTASTDLFSGSHFPGSISFSRDSNDGSEFGIPGATLFTSHGSGQTFTISWSEVVPGLPSLLAQYSTSSSSSEIVGIDGEATASSKNLSLGSQYRLRGFDLAGTFSHSNQEADAPAFLEGPARHSEGSSTGYSVTTSHSFPLSGNFGAGWSWSGYGSADNGRTSSSNANAGVGINPFRNLTVNTNFTYNSNELAFLQQRLFGQNGAPILLPKTYGSQSLGFNTSASYLIWRGTSVQFYLNHHRSYFNNRDISDTNYGGQVAYRNSHRFFGVFSLSAGFYEGYNNKRGNTSSGGAVASAGLTRRIKKWEISGNVGYTQSLAMVSWVTTSSVGYGASVSRKFNEDTYFNAAFGGSHTAIVREPGTSAASENFSTGFGWRRFGLGANYSQSRGTTVLTPSGLLTPTPLASLISDNLLFYNGSGWGITFSGALVRRLSLLAAYSTSRSESQSPTRDTLIRGERYTTRLRYRLRKVDLQAGYRRTWQGMSTSGAPPRVFNSYFFEISRWFGVF